MPVTIKNRDDGIEINGYRFSQEEFEKIQTRIQNNEFTGEWSHVKAGITVRRVGDELILSKPQIYPKESWTFQQWVEQSDGWKDYAQASPEEWQTEFEQLSL